MIYITSGQTTYIPRTNQEAGVNVHFENQTTHKEYSASVVGYSAFYYSFMPDDMPDGQYSYVIEDIDGHIIESGIGQAGNFVPNYEQYPMEKITYTTYKYD